MSVKKHIDDATKALGKAMESIRKDLQADPGNPEIANKSNNCKV